jgi:RNA polymerase sigma factor (sigma-70 family)
MGRDRFYRFWFHNKDDQGRPLDESILKAAEEMAPILSHYREQELDCESHANEIMQSAIEAASKATRTTPIKNPIAYITSAYRRLVDKNLDRRSRVIPVDDEFLEELSDSGRVESFEQGVHDRLVIEKLMNLMDPRTREICDLIIQGYTQKEIAEDLGMTPNTLSVEFNRELKKTARRMHQRYHRAHKK